MADNEESQAEAESESPADDGVAAEPEPESAPEPVEAAASDEEPPDAGRREMKVLRARVSLEEEAEAARRRVLGARRTRLRPAAVQTTEADEDIDLQEHLRELVRGVEEETERLQEDVHRLRSAAGRAGTTLKDEIERAATELAEDSIGDLETTVGEGAAEALEALRGAIEGLQETASGLNAVAAGLQTSIEQLTKVAPVAEELAELASAPPAIPEALAGVISDLTEQLSALGDAVSVQVRSSLEEVLAAELGRHEARIEHGLARLVDELARLRRRLPVAKRGAAIDLSKDQLTAIGEAVGDYLLAAMREQQS